jgi:hypothetical protein
LSFKNITVAECPLKYQIGWSNQIALASPPTDGTDREPRPNATVMRPAIPAMAPADQGATVLVVPWRRSRIVPPPQAHSEGASQGEGDEPSGEAFTQTGNGRDGQASQDGTGQGNEREHDQVPPCQSEGGKSSGPREDE